MSNQHYNDFLNRPGGHHKWFSDCFKERVPTGLSLCDFKIVSEHDSK